MLNTFLVDLLFSLYGLYSSVVVLGIVDDASALEETFPFHRAWKRLVVPISLACVVKFMGLTMVWKCQEYREVELSSIRKDGDHSATSTPQTMKTLQWVFDTRSSS